MRRWWRAKSSPSVASSSSARSSSSAAHSSSKNSSVVSIAVPFSWHALQQRAVGGVGGVDREAQVRVGAGAAGELLDLAELAHRLDQAGAVELGELAGVALGERVGAALGVGEQRVDGGLRVVAGAVEQVGQVPGDLLRSGSLTVSGAVMPLDCVGRAAASEAFAARRPSITIARWRRHASGQRCGLRGRRADAAHEHRDVVEHEVRAQVARRPGRGGSSSRERPR